MSGTRLARLGLLAASVPLLVYLREQDSPWELMGGPVFFAPDPFPGLVIASRVALWWAALVCVVLCAVLFATAGLWAQPLPSSPGRARGLLPRHGARSFVLLPRHGTRSFVLLLCAAALLGGALRVNLWGSGFFHDEAWTLKKAVIGEWVDREDGGEPEFAPLPWRKTFWAWRRPTNHVFFSVASRATTETWQAVRGLPQHAFDERVVRLPALLASALGIAALGLLVAAFGFPRAGVFAAFLLALHPWHVEYGPAARGYGLMVLFGLAAALAFRRGLQTASWTAWLTGAAALLLMLWSQTVSLFLALSLGAAVLVGALALPGERRLRGVRTGRLIVSCLLAAMLLGLLFAPNVAQMRHWPELGGSSASGAAARFWPLIVWGLPLRGLDPVAGVSFPSYAGLLEQHAWLSGVTWGLLPALALVGAVALWRRGGATRWVALGMALAVPLAQLLIRTLQIPLYDRFMLFALPGTLPLLAVGLDRTLGRLAGARERFVVPVGLGLALVGFVGLTAPQLTLLAGREYSGERAVVAAIEHAREDSGGPVLAAGLGLGGHMPKVYDPGIRWLGSVEDVRAACRESRRDGVPLYLFSGYRDVNHHRFPEVFTWLEDPDLFESVGVFPGVRPEFVFELFRYRGEPLTPGRRERGS